jgi:MoaA/NifB/PqqE/SkfB family radical SAM enzyme
MSSELDSIGFYTLRDERAKNCSIYSPMERACFVITGRCNFNCSYCNGSSCSKDFTLEQVNSILIDLSQNHNLRAVRFTGGEPTIHKDLLSMVKTAKSLNINKIAISTNGSASSDYYDKLVEEGVNDFSISADSGDLKITDKLSGRIGMFNIVKNNIYNLSKKTNVIIGTTVNAENLNKIPETLKFLGDLGVSDIKLATATQFEGNIPLNILNMIPQELLDRMPVLKYRVENYKNNRLVRGLVEGRDSHRCWWVQDDIVLTPDGHFPCIVYPREKGAAIGNIKSVAEMRETRLNWAIDKDTFCDPICKKYCMDIFADCNKRIEYFKGIDER